MNPKILHDKNNVYCLCLVLSSVLLAYSSYQNNAMECIKTKYYTTTSVLLYEIDRNTRAITEMNNNTLTPSISVEKSVTIITITRSRRYDLYDDEIEDRRRD